MTNEAHVGGKTACVHEHTPTLVATLWRRLRDRLWWGFLHVKANAEESVCPEARSPDQSKTGRIKTSGELSLSILVVAL